jgi:hypothetical protein
MKLLKELLTLKEEAIQVRDASEVWEEGKDSVKTYIAKKTYVAREVEGEDGTEYEVYTEKNGKRKLVITLSSTDFKSAYVPVRADQSEDAEGYKTYREDIEVEAFRYEGDTIKVDLGGDKETLKKGDYLIRKIDGDNFIYLVEEARFFDEDYTEKK